MLILNECKKPGESFIPVRLLRLNNYLVFMLLHSEDENTWCIYAQNRRGSWISQTFLSKSMSWFEWQTLVGRLAMPEIVACLERLKTLTDPEARFYTLQELCQLNLGDYAFFGREENEALARRVSDQDILPELDPITTDNVMDRAAKLDAQLKEESEVLARLVSDEDEDIISEVDAFIDNVMARASKLATQLVVEEAS